MERKRIKKYNTGGSTLPKGFTAGAGFTGTAAGQGIGMFGGMLGSYITQADQADGHMSTGGALGGGALKGAAMGAALGPIGMLGGAAIGAIGGLMQRDKFNDEQRKKEEAEAEAERARKAAEEQLKLQQMDAALEAHPVKGTGTPRFTYGGETEDPPMAFNTKYVGIPSFADPMDRNATPTMNWYLDGQPVSGTDMVKALPEGTNINDLGNYWYRKMKPRYDAVDGWSNVGNNNDAIRANTMLANMQQSEYSLGGPTGDGDPLPKTYNAEPYPNMPMGRELRYERGMPYYYPVDTPNGSIRQWEPSMFDYLREAAMNSFNPVNIIGNSDVQMRTDRYGGEGLMGRAGLNNRDRMYANDKNDILPDWVYGLAGVEKKALGGSTLPQYEAEGGEMIQYKQGDMPKVYGTGGITEVSSQEYEIKGPSHAQGGVDMSDEKGARIYSNKLTVDKALMEKLSKL